MLEDLLFCRLILTMSCARVFLKGHLRGDFSPKCGDPANWASLSVGLPFQVMITLKETASLLWHFYHDLLQPLTSLSHDVES